MKLLLVINVADDVAENYEDFTVDYDLRGTPINDGKVNESIKYVEDADVRPLPKVKTREEEVAKDPVNEDLFYDDFINGWNACLDEILGETE